jgi:hypothetical protein
MGCGKPVEEPIMTWILRMAAALALMVLATGPEPAVAKPDQPDYAVVTGGKEFEIRDYSTMVVAQITMRGTYRRGVSDGYILLERYFLGENTVPERIAMTVPVMVRDDAERGWTTMFMLPRDYLRHTAPRPKDQRIRVVELPPRQVAVVKFRGKLNDAVMREQVARLEAWLTAQGIAHRGDFLLAGYNQISISGNTGNEVLVTLK